MDVPKDKSIIEQKAKSYATFYLSPCYDYQQKKKRERKKREDWLAGENFFSHQETGNKHLFCFGL